MKSLTFARGAAVLFAALVGAGAAVAQSSSRVLTDVGPLPAENRSSTGAIVLATEPVLAQAEMMDMAARQSTSVMGNSAERVMERARTRSDLQDVRTKEAVDLHQRGARSLNK